MIWEIFGFHAPQCSSGIPCSRNQQEVNSQKNFICCLTIRYPSGKSLKCEFRATDAFLGYCINILVIYSSKQKVFAIHKGLMLPTQFLKHFQGTDIHHILVSSKRAITESLNWLYEKTVWTWSHSHKDIFSECQVTVVFWVSARFLK